MRQTWPLEKQSSFPYMHNTQTCASDERGRMTGSISCPSFHLPRIYTGNSRLIYQVVPGERHTPRPAHRLRLSPIRSRRPVLRLPVKAQQRGTVPMNGHNAVPLAIGGQCQCPPLLRSPPPKGRERRERERAREAFRD